MARLATTIRVASMVLFMRAWTASLRPETPGCN
jgi:hypothetical protein